MEIFQIYSGIYSLILKCVLCPPFFHVSCMQINSTVTVLLLLAILCIMQAIRVHFPTITLGTLLKWTDHNATLYFQSSLQPEVSECRTMNPKSMTLNHNLLIIIIQTKSFISVLLLYFSFTSIYCLLYLCCLSNSN